MKPESTTIFSRIILLIAALITALGIVFMAITYIVATNYYESSTQLLNRDVAAHIAKFTSPFKSNGLDKAKADSVFYDAMVLSPNSEVYFLDTTGKVVDYHKSGDGIRQWQLSLSEIHAYIAAGGKTYIKGPDPRDPSKHKIFSAAKVERGGRKLGYIYVILASSEARAVAAMLLSNQVIILAVTAFCCIIVLSLLLSFLYVRRIQRRFNRVIDVLDRFQQGDFDARFRIHRQDGLAPIKGAFNTMADLLVYHINRLTKSERDRKLFIAGITHDLRNPLAIAGGYAETLLIKASQGMLSTTQQDDYMKLVLQKVRQVEKMVAQLHELSAMESISFEPKREPFMLSELVQEVANAFHNTAQERSIKIDCMDCEDDAYIEADVSMIERVMQNLLANAVAYSKEGTTVFVSLKRAEGQLLCLIENTSAALPPALLNWVTDEAESSHAPLPQMPALGLSIVRRILHIHQYPLTVSCTGGTIVFQFSMQVYTTHRALQV